jgi:hypothetical protein
MVSELGGGVGPLAISSLVTMARQCRVRVRYHVVDADNRTLLVYSISTLVVVPLANLVPVPRPSYSDHI